MNKYWMAVFIATIFEVIWVIGLKYSTNIIEWIGTIICILLTFVLLTFANKKLPIGTTYTVFTGIGTVGTILADVILFNQEITLLKIFFIIMLIIGVIGLKMVTTSNELALEKERI
ncbi:multidrug efflux SMR transporter [Poseidonibacter sp. 1_MG-2023]|uniref:DMT family transporter n=1 Tax=Poseidonibacter TaxID=2321187 RepID=UPI001E4C1D51|nr:MULTISPECIES: multidrug efflux SMR transporter [Poseidonibacter]MDO6829232.1 multidrug efflux SMR transporter [Poseidonibacter sp. 1_MG-2023]